ncbi:type II toxin-antitoxin system ParD family antitoxin [Sphingomonas sp. MAH-20]|uniref:Type II toxin-antitoxin system ParD family antitoxin n=1 Tax=Sphingomonas horti TaxID=2682842 RepID=A0A6I4IYL3_9SPHN|nr:MULTISPECIES: type II toxin-antitoxin system ParD family antitoxin [Sphingomonas]MBA2918197.1 type II toxin-antitoxin system ParD family antitoxin [Sphingomonas sp. CGMCC 1.13658]MVO77166.1 type II toxin-antitoxin system ParD family antitoxin [Sphingomonas horti]
MPVAAEKPVTVTLGRLGGLARRLVEEGRYASVSEVMRAGLRALEREEAALDELIKAKVAEALADPRPPIPMEEAFQRAYARLAERDGLD